MAGRDGDFPGEIAGGDLSGRCGIAGDAGAVRAAETSPIRIGGEGGEEEGEECGEDCPDGIDSRYHFAEKIIDFGAEMEGGDERFASGFPDVALTRPELDGVI